MNESTHHKALHRIEEAANSAHALGALVANQLSGVELDATDFCVLLSDGIGLLEKRLDALHSMLDGGSLNHPPAET